MSIERTSLANEELNARINRQIDLANLGARLVQAVAEGDDEVVDQIKEYWRSRQTWRNA